MHQAGVRLAAESLAAGLLAGAASVMAVGYLLDAVRLPLAPSVLAIGAITGGAITFHVVQRASPSGGTRRQLLEVSIFLLITALVCGYLLWLASPSLLPVADGPDIVHHLLLVHVIQRTLQLVKDPGMEPYLGEMMHYTPGSHVLAAAFAMWLRVDALRVVYPVMALCAALKCALLFLTAVRAMPESRSPLHAAAAAVLVIVPAEYFFGSLLKFGFYAQVVSEMFAAGMLLATVLWARSGARVWLVLFSICAIGAFLAWPVWVPAAMLALALTIVLRRPAISEGVGDMLIAFAPIAIIGGLHLIMHRGGASILGSAGVVTIPSLEVVSVVFIALALLGALLAIGDVRARSVVIVAAAVLLQAFGLAVLNRLAGSGSLYLPYKMVYLLVLPCAVLAALVLSRLAALVPSRNGLFRAASAVVPLAIAVPIAWERVPRERLRSPITESSYAAGLWTRDHLPAGCVDYFSRHWLTGYWLHLDVLGNARVSPRMREETFEFRDTVGKWIEGRGQPFAIVEDMPSIPREVRPMMETLQSFGSVAVVKNRGLTPIACRD